MTRDRTVQILSRGAMLMSIATAVLTVSGFKSLSTGTRSAQLNASDRYSPINIRLNSSTQSQALQVGFSGDRIEVLQQQTSSDGFTWYQVRFQQTGATGWVRGDLVQFNQGGGSQPMARAPESGVPVAQPIATATRSRSNLPSVLNRSTVTQEQIDYFLEIAMGSEFYREDNPILRKWSGDVRIQPLGKPTSADLATLQSVINEINALTNGSLRLRLDNTNPNLKIHFVSESQFRSLEPGYVPVNYGFFMTRWDASGAIHSATVLINSDNVITQKERSHLIREELTQSLGLMRDSMKYADSMFYQPWTDITQFSALDRTLIQLLYSPDIRAGMTRAQVMTVLNGYLAQ